MKRSVRLSLRAKRHASTKIRNGKIKSAERVRRDARMLATVKGGSLPFAQGIMSWLSARLDKKASRITQADLKKLSA